MDNRRLSARADYGASGPARPYATPYSFLNRAFELTRVNWEVLIFVGLMFIAVFTRLWDLGTRAFSHDESIHAFFSDWYLKTGDYTTTAGYQGGYDPTYHGPLLYHMVALGNLLFGTSDATARIMPAIFGIILVGLCWLLRPFIGRLGALIAAALVILSPSISYYSRSLRHDIFVLTGTMLLFVSILWFMRTHQPKWAYLGALGLIVAFASHELIYIVGFIFVLFLVIAAFLFPSFSSRAESNTRNLVGDEDVNPVRSAWSSLLRQRWTIVACLVIFFAIYIVLYTNMLTKPQLILSGFTESLKYWLSQQNVARGTQPGFYYFLLMPVYEPLALLAGLGTVVYMVAKWLRRGGDTLTAADVVDVRERPTTDEYGFALPSIYALRGVTLAFLAFWAFGSFIAFSFAGEKMPWLLMQMALPFSLLAAAGLARLCTSLDWRQAFKGGGIFLGVAVVLFIFVAFALVAFLNGSMPAPTGPSAGVQTAMRAVLLFLFTVGLLALSAWLAYKLLPGRAVKVVALTFVLLLFGYGLRSMMLLNYRHPDVPVEMMIYTQTAPDVPIVADMIKRLSRDETSFDANRSAADVTGGHNLEISIDQTDATEWPFDWYFRDMLQRKYFNSDQWAQNQANVVSPNVPVIIASTATENTDSFKNFIKGKYTTNEYVLNWWFPEEGTYKKNNVGDLGTAWNWITGNGLKYLLYRDIGPNMQLGTRNFYLHVRNDLAVKVGLGAPTGAQTTPPQTSTGPTPNGPVYTMFSLAPVGAERGQFNLPRGITTDASGNFYVVDTANMRVQKFDRTGKFLATIGNGVGNGDGQFNPFSSDAVGTGPGGIAVDKSGNIYVADTWNHRVQKFDPNGKFLAKWGDFINLGDPSAASDPARDSKFFGPRGIAIGPDGNVYVTDTGNKRVSIFDPTGKFIRQISSGMSPSKVSPNYPFSQPGEMNEPIGIAVDGSGNVYVADSKNKRIQKFDPAGNFAAQWPIPDNSWDPAAYLEPFLALDSGGNLYATAPAGQKVLEFSPAGVLIGQKAGQGAVTLKTPTGITVGSDGTVYVVDTTANGVINLGKMP